jgi:hypothetical protein
MVKKILIIFALLFVTIGFSASQFDKEIIVLNQSRNDKVVSVFKAMMKAYEEEDLSGFFSYVSEDRFIQDYMTFYDAIEKDMRVYDILNVDTWVDKITDDGIKRYLYVRWDKRYQSTTSDNELSKKGYSRFLFDEVNGKYKLIGLAGNNFWGGSLSEWTQDMPQIAGQEKENSGLPDLIIVNAMVDAQNIQTIVTVKNQGTADAVLPFSVLNQSSNLSAIFTNGVPAGASVIINIINDQDVSSGDLIIVDSNNNIIESNENNNQAFSQ